MRLRHLLLPLALLWGCDLDPRRADQAPAPGPSDAARLAPPASDAPRITTAPTAFGRAAEDGPRPGEPPPLASLAPLVEDVRGAVVGVTASDPSRLHGMLPGAERQWEEFFRGEREGPPPSLREPGPQLGVGSGVIVDGSGLVVTNNHVIENARHVLVRTSEDVEYRADVIGRDAETDIAVLRLRDVEGELPVARLGDSDGLAVGDYVVAIGNPFGLEFTVTSGIISAKSRVIGAGPFDEFLQTDAAINPGNSGGPLFDLNGYVVGINTAIVAGGQGIGFAVPIDLVKALLPDLVAHGRIDRGYLGVSIQDITPAIGRALKVDEGDGAVVVNVEPKSPAARAGLRQGDVVVSVEQEQVDSAAALSRKVAQLSPGERVQLEVLRDGRARRIDLKLGQRPQR
jgi:serine protease Do